MVELEVRTEVPPGAGTIIAVEWDFDGQGKYPFGHEVSGKDSALTLSTSHEFDQPGTYFPTARVVSHREGDLDAKLRRSEEHTSELQSLMRISYAVFCLKKKKTQH